SRRRGRQGVQHSTVIVLTSKVAIDPSYEPGHCPTKHRLVDEMKRPRNSRLMREPRAVGTVKSPGAGGAIIVPTGEHSLQGVGEFDVPCRCHPLEHALPVAPLPVGPRYHQL